MEQSDSSSISNEQVPAVATPVAKTPSAPEPRAEPGDPQGTTYDVRADGATVVTFPNNRQQVRAPRGARFLTKAKILAAKDAVYEDVHVPEWAENGDPMSAWVRCKGLSAAERGFVEAQMVRVDADTGKTEYDGRHMREWFCAYGIVDEQGSRLFANKEVHQLGAKSAAALDRCYEKVTELSRVSKKDLREMVGNLNSSPSDDSLGGSANDGEPTLTES